MILIDRRCLFLAFMDDDVCPMCLGRLDTSWECLDCGFDAMSLAEEKGAELCEECSEAVED